MFPRAARAAWSLSPKNSALSLPPPERRIRTEMIPAIAPFESPPHSPNCRRSPKPPKAWPCASSSPSPNKRPSTGLSFRERSWVVARFWKGRANVLLVSVPHAAVQTDERAPSRQDASWVHCGETGETAEVTHVQRQDVPDTMDNHRRC